MGLYELSKQVAEIDLEHGWNNDEISDTVIHMTEELGEISECMLIRSGYKAGEFKKEELEDEICDLIYLSLKLGNKLDLNLESAWTRLKCRCEKK